MVAPRAVVIGAGPAGLAAAYILHKQGSQVTLVEKVEEPGVSDPSRAFSYLITERGFKAIERMGLLESLMEEGTANNSMIINKFTNNQPPKRFSVADFQSQRQKIPPGYWIIRSKFVRMMFEHVKTLPIDLHLGKPVTQVKFTDKGARVYIDGNETPLEADLVIAADGSRSKVRSVLHNCESGGLDSTCGFDLTKLYSPAVGLPYKTLVCGPCPSLPEKQADGTTKDTPAKPDELYTFVGTLKGADFTQLSLMPVGSDPKSPRVAVMTVPKNQTIWKADTADAAFDLLQGNFPYLNLRSLVTEREMGRFAAAKASHFPPIQRCNSLVGTRGDTSGVCFIGDAAHAFPPDLGQGVNSALEDVTCLADALSENDKLSDALRAYEDGRSEDVDALLRLMQLGNPYQYRQNLFRLRLVFFNSLIRSVLNGLAPRLFHPKIFLMISDGRYRDVLRRENVTTQRIYVLVAALIAGAAFLLVK